MRPSTYDETHERSCANCRHCHLLAYKQDLLCFHGDTIEITGHSQYPVVSDCISLKGVDVELLDGDDYDKIWADRVVDHHGVCDQWQPEGAE